MKASTIERTTVYLATSDLARLRDIIATIDHFTIANSGIETLKSRIGSAEIKPAELLPVTAVTIGSFVKILDLTTKEMMEFVLAFPGDCDDSGRTVSILDPIGAAILGASEGETILYERNSTFSSVRIEEVVFQPIEYEFGIE